MAHTSLEHLLYTDHDYSMSFQDRSLQSLYMTALDLSGALRGIGITGENQKIGLDLLGDLSQDIGLIRERQDVIRYIFNHKEYSKITEELQVIFSLMHSINNTDIWSRDSHGHAVGLIPERINAKMEKYAEIIVALRNFSETYDEIHLNDIADEMDSLSSSERYKKLKEKMPFTGKIDRGYADENMYKIDERINSIGEVLDDYLTPLYFFYKTAITFHNLQEQGHPVTFPELETGGYRIFDVEKAINPLLLIGENAKRKPIPIDLYSDELTPIHIITGENTYGKTMALKTRGIIQAFAQAGLPVLAKKARLSKVNVILSNIGLTEDTYQGKSTYQNINETSFKMIQSAITRTLLLLDEPTLGTYDLKALKQAKIYLDEMGRAGYDCWVVTHHLQVAEDMQTHPLISALMTETIDGKPTYQLTPGIFEPKEETMILDYPQRKVAKAVKEHYTTRLEKLLKKGKIPEDQIKQATELLEELRGMYGSKT